MLDLLATLTGPAFLVGATALALWVDRREARELGGDAPPLDEEAGAGRPARPPTLRLVVSR